MASSNTITIEDKHMLPIFTKIPISIDRGEGVYVWDEEGNKFLNPFRERGGFGYRRTTI